MFEALKHLQRQYFKDIFPLKFFLLPRKRKKPLTHSQINVRDKILIPFFTMTNNPSTTGEKKLGGLWPSLFKSRIRLRPILKLVYFNR